MPDSHEERDFSMSSDRSSAVVRPILLVLTISVAVAVTAGCVSRGVASPASSASWNGQADIAGDYLAVQRNGASVLLTILPDRGFEYVEEGATPVRCRGVWSLKEGLVELLPARASEDDPYPKMPLVWRPVRWGARVYMLPEGKLIRFCNAINLGDEPRTSPEGVNPLRRDDWSRAVIGPPDLPREWLDMLLRAPLSGRVVDVEPDGFVRLSIGGHDGLKTGMAMAVGHRGQARCCMLKVVCPCERSARAEVVGREECGLVDAPWGDVQVGDETATRRSALSWRARTASDFDVIFTPELVALPVVTHAPGDAAFSSEVAAHFAQSFSAARPILAGAITSQDIRRLALRMPELMEGATLDRRWLEQIVLTPTAVTEPSGFWLLTHPLEHGQPLPATRAIHRRLCISVEYDPSRRAIVSVYVTIRGWVEE